MTTPAPSPRARRRVLPAGLVLALVVAGLSLLDPARAGAAPTQRTSATAKPWPGHPGRHLVSYRVRRGDTATRIATRFHAWTAELLRINHKNRSSAWAIGERVTVPVVTARARPTSARSGSGARPSKARVRAEVVRVAKAQGVRPKLALAIAWQESGWQQHVRSDVGAVGTMQVMPGNEKWLSSLVGRRLHLERLHDNVVAGVTLFRLLRATHGVQKSLAAYYQGLGSLHEHGRYRSTKLYVTNIERHWTRLVHGWDPLG